MSKVLLKTVAIALFLSAFASMTALADGVPAPMCYPNPCPQQ